ncbi:MAG: hypothetical protein JWQ54_4148 [Mucilaginibacter sp.]|nr:hypothetical protein [Mucilaginibacter sp.]
MHLVAERFFGVGYYGKDELAQGNKAGFKLFILPFKVNIKYFLPSGFHIYDLSKTPLYPAPYR